MTLRVLRISQFENGALRQKTQKKSQNTQQKVQNTSFLNRFSTASMDQVSFGKKFDPKKISSDFGKTIGVFVTGTMMGPAVTKIGELREVEIELTPEESEAMSEYPISIVPSGQTINNTQDIPTFLDARNGYAKMYNAEPDKGLRIIKAKKPKKEDVKNLRYQFEKNSNGNIRSFNRVLNAILDTSKPLTLKDVDEYKKSNLGNMLNNSLITYVSDENGEVIEVKNKSSELSLALDSVLKSDMRYAHRFKALKHLSELGYVEYKDILGALKCYNLAFKVHDYLKANDSFGIKECTSFVCNTASDENIIKAVKIQENIKKITDTNFALRGWSPISSMYFDASMYQR